MAAKYATRFCNMRSMCDAGGGWFWSAREREDDIIMDEGAAIMQPRKY